MPVKKHQGIVAGITGLVRETMGLLIIAGGLVFVGAAFYRLAYMAPPEGMDAADAFDLAITSLLPVIGTWVGAVIAFYFTKENFEAAARNQERLFEHLSLNERLESKPALVHAIRVREIDSVKLIDDKAEETPLSLLEAVFKEHRQRVPILRQNGSVFTVVHYSTFTDFLSRRIGRPDIGPSANRAEVIENATVKTLIESPEVLRFLYDGIRTVPVTATLATVKQIMDSAELCQDVFITKTGDRSEPIEGWITNNELQRQLETD